VTRAQFITFLHRAMDPSAKKANPDPPGSQSYLALGIPGDVDDHGRKTFNTRTENGDDVTFTAEVSSYRVFDTDDGFPQVDGYEYRVMTVHLTVKNTDVGRTYYVGPINDDCYNAGLYEDSKTVDDNGMETHTVIYNGVPTECTIWDRYDFADRDGYFHVDWTWTASVPKGYDGLVIGLGTSRFDAPGLRLNEFYTSEDSYVLYRMK